MVKKKSIKNYKLRIKNYGLFLFLILNFQFSIFNCFLYGFQKVPYFSQSAGKTVDIAGGEVIVKSSDIESVNLKFGTSIIQKLKGENIYLLKLPAGETVESFLSKISGFRGVIYAEPNYLVKMFSNDTYYDNQWALPKTDWQTAYNSSATLTSSFYAGSSTFVVIAVIDSGVDWQHPDLANVFRFNNADIYGDGIDNDNNGYIDDTYGYNTLYGQSPPTSATNTEKAEYTDRRPWDTDGHGTHVAGIASAQINNSEGIAGVSWVSRIMAVKVFHQDGDGGTFFNIAAGLKYAADNGAKVINMSLGGPVGSATAKEAIDYAVSKGCVVVVASGNEYENAISYPAAYDNCIAVGASNSSDKRVSFSNYGPQLDVVAPGGGNPKIYSTYSIFYATASGDVDLNYSRGPTYTYMAGTSMATPFVSGLAALVISQNPAFTPKQVEQRIEETCDDIDTPGRDFYSGWGRVNVYRALSNNKNAYYVSSGAQNVKSYPNPFYPDLHGRVTIRLPQSHQSAEKFRITIYNIAGSPVKLFDSSSLETSMGDEGLVYWDGKNDNGDKVASGLYYYVIDTGGKKFRGKITLIK